MTWHPIATAPNGEWLATMREGEAGEENLPAAAKQRLDVLDYLYYTLEPIAPITRERDEPRGLYRKTR